MELSRFKPGSYPPGARHPVSSAPEFVLDPDVTSMELLQKVDLASRASIHKAAFKLKEEEEQKDPLVNASAAPAAPSTLKGSQQVEQKEKQDWRKTKKVLLWIISGWMWPLPL